MPVMTKENLIECINPANGEKIFEITIPTKNEMNKKVQKARNALSVWSCLSIEERTKYLRDLYEIIINDRDKIAKTISKNTGKPLAESYLTEIASTLQVMDYCIKKGTSLLSAKKINLGHLYPGKNSSITYFPYGVIAIIEPWNYPFYLPMAAITKALICGNTCIFKPSSCTALVGNLIEELFKKASFPEGVINLIYGDCSCGEELINCDIDKVIFTGSTEAGKKIAELCVRKLIPVSLELGGKDPAIVLKDSNIEYAAGGILWGALSNCGQACASIERVYVHSEIYNNFLKEITNLTKQLKVGSPLEEDSDVGPLVTEEQLKKVENHIEDALQKGAQIITGGKRIPGSGFFLEPTILSNVNHSMKVMSDETFGPVIPVMKFDTVEEAVKLANETKYGLAASIWAGNTEAAEKIAGELICGTVWINDSLFLQAHPECPWQGYKESGYGGSVIYDFVRTKHIGLDYGFIPSIRPKNFWWYPYKGKSRSFSDLIPVFFRQNIKDKAQAAFETFIDFLR